MGKKNKSGQSGNPAKQAAVVERIEDTEDIEDVEFIEEDHFGTFDIDGLEVTLDKRALKSGRAFKMVSIARKDPFEAVPLAELLFGEGSYDRIEEHLRDDDGYSDAAEIVKRIFGVIKEASPNSSSS